MRTYTVQTRADRLPVLVPEGWSFWAFPFGPLWFFGRRAWIPGLLDLAAWVLVVAFAPSAFWFPALFGLALLQALLGRDLVRWYWALRGYALAHVVLGRNEEGALARLVETRPELLQSYAGRVR